MDRKERRELQREYLFFAECPQCGEIYEVLPAMLEYWAQRGYRILVLRKKEVAKDRNFLASLSSSHNHQEVYHA